MSGGDTGPERYTGDMTVEAITEAAIARAREIGCVCDPVVSMIVARIDGDELFLEPTVAHDDWCPLLRSFEGERPA